MLIPAHVRIIAVAIAFTVLLSLAVSLIFLSSVDSVAKDEHVIQESTTAPQEPPNATTTTPSSEPPPPVVSLEFASNGNGTCTVTGLGTATASSVVIPEYAPNGDRVTAIAPQAFYGERTVAAIHIPASVVHIGNLAFADCKDLTYVSVSAQNSAYRSVDGVLYTADLSVLILYPPRRAGESLTVHTATTVIREMAFFDCVYLQRIDYMGSPAQWEKISIGEKNYSLLAIAKHFGR